jgi:hypothetical protein
MDTDAWLLSLESTSAVTVSGQGFRQTVDAVLGIVHAPVAFYSMDAVRRYALDST